MNTIDTKNSSSIKSIQYEGNDIAITFIKTPNLVYIFHGVPMNVIQGLSDAESVGRYFMENIKNRYLFDKKEVKTMKVTEGENERDYWETSRNITETGGLYLIVVEGELLPHVFEYIPYLDIFASQYGDYDKWVVNKYHKIAL